MRYIVYLAAFAACVGACSGSESEAPPSPPPAPVESAAGKTPNRISERLHGTWQSDAMTVKIDLASGTYSGVVLGEPFNRKITILDEYANVVTFKSDSSTITAQFQSDGGLLLTKQGVEGGIPVLLKRAE